MSNTKLRLFLGACCTLGLGAAPWGCDAGSSSEETSADAGTGPSSGTTAGEGTAEGTGDETADGTADPPTGDSGSDSEGDIDIEPANMIDDLEDGDALILAASGRRGAWYTYNDETEGAVQDPPTPFEPTAGGPGTSLFMALTSGSGFTLWGAGLGVDLNNEGDPDGGPGVRMPYDASAHQGIVFRARGNTAVRVKLLVDAIVPTETGGSCAADCEDAHGKIVPLSDDWVQYTVGFDEVFQEGWGAAAAFDAGTMMAVQFQVSASTDFEFSIDDVGFY
ncbi:CIA30 family protein [Paraliomyxa miuraensis]|uniref:carbohydrate binding domain-containing protein n=1 Tax=Paraliomyxa miuraensis TaxID=376150 RepID=UPI002258DE06|nr:carbohydrate binding domain-containing protein [Paraliomyxa miuraensis]MCX4244863.1 hypothetical protein [Paraliomyxa miuraensis]